MWSRNKFASTPTPEPKRSLLRAPGLLLLWLAGCTYEAVEDLRPASNADPFQIVKQTPFPGQVDVSCGAPVDIFFSRPPDPATVTQNNFRIYSGIYEILSTPQTDLLLGRVRLSPSGTLRPSLRYKVQVSRAVRSLDGQALAQEELFDFTTGTRTRYPEAPAEPVRYFQDLLPLMNRKCIQCHNAAWPTAGVDLSSPQGAWRTLPQVPAAVPGRMRVVPFSHAESYLMFKLLDRGGILGNGMPASGTRLTEQELRQVAGWIDGGAL